MEIADREERAHSLACIITLPQIQTIQAYLDFLRIQQSQLAMLSPSSQQSQLAAAAAAAAANNAQLVVLSPSGQNVTVHSLNSPVSSNASATPSSSVASMPTPAASPVAGSQANGSQQASITLNIPSPHANIIVDSSQVGVQPVGSSGLLASSHAVASAGGEPLPQSITAELDAIVIVLYGDASAEATNKDPDPKTAKESVAQRQAGRQTQCDGQRAVA